MQPYIQLQRGGKAAGLARLESIPGIKVPTFIVIDQSLDDAAITAKLATFLKTHSDMERVAVRSSGAQEDSHQASFAGMYETKLDVPADVDSVRQAIAEIRTHAANKSDTLAHYAQMRNTEMVSSGLGIIVQRMLQPERAGVLFSHGPATRDGYYLISTTSGTGETIADGSVNGQLFRVVRGMTPATIQKPWLAELIATARLIEEYLDTASLDIEFAFEAGVLYILQCRPLTTVLTSNVNEAGLPTYVAELGKKIAEEHAGDILGDMIDINPGELLGRSPSPLEVSIFRHVLGDTIVERARSQIGYAPLHVGLIRVVEGKPYVSLRASAFSFRPDGISEPTYRKLVEVYRSAVANNPGHQDRVEFDVFAMRRGKRLERTIHLGGLAMREARNVRDSFAELEERIDTRTGEFQRSLGSNVQVLKQTGSAIPSVDPWQLLEHSAKWASLFVEVARLAFYWRNAFDETRPGIQTEALLQGKVRTNASMLREDLRAFRANRLSRGEIIEKYGHIRPGQFSLFGETYADDPDYYLFGLAPDRDEMRHEKAPQGMERDQMFRCMLFFMEAREEVKFWFARALSIFANSLRVWLASSGLDEATASRCTWHDLMRYSKDAKPIEGSGMGVILPNVIIPGMDLRQLTEQSASATYVTTQRVTANIHVLESNETHPDITGKLVLIRNADPGYDFLFRAGVAGIVTQNGGPASHMCIRAIEMDTPACIGCGAHAFERLSGSRVAILDCETGRLTPV